MRLVVLRSPAADAELAADRLWACGAGGVEVRGGADGWSELRTVLGESDAQVAARLGPLPPGWVLHFDDVDPTPSDSWRAHAAPIEIAPDLVVRPAWLPPLDRAGTVEVEIEPGASFGLGDHPTTRLAAAAVRRLVRPGMTVLDVGCGSGVLGVVAARLGARAVTAIDVAEAARLATVDNARRNGVAGRIEASTMPIADVRGAFDLVVANILAPVLISIARDLRRCTAGRLVIAGILAERHDHVLDALAPMTVVRTDARDGWAVVELAPG